MEIQAQGRVWDRSDSKRGPEDATRCTGTSLRWRRRRQYHRVMNRKQGLARLKRGRMLTGVSRMRRNRECFPEWRDRFTWRRSTWRHQGLPFRRGGRNHQLEQKMDEDSMITKMTTMRIGLGNNAEELRRTAAIVV